MGDYILSHGRRFVETQETLALLKPQISGPKSGLLTTMTIQLRCR